MRSTAHVDNVGLDVGLDGSGVPADPVASFVARGRVVFTGGEETVTWSHTPPLMTDVSSICDGFSDFLGKRLPVRG